MPFTIRDFQVTDDDYALIATMASQITPQHARTGDSIRREDDEIEDQYHMQRYIIEHDGEPVGNGIVQHTHWMHHPNRFYIYVEVLPTHRQQGAGTALYEHMLASIKALEPRELYTSTLGNHTDAIRYIEKAGFEEVLREWESRLDPTDYDFSSYAGLAEKLSEQGITVQSWSEIIQSEDRARRLYDLEKIIEFDIPAPEKPTFDSFEVWMQSRQPDNPEFLPDGYFIAVHEDSYIGCTNLWRSGASGDLYIGTTGVRREYRRRGIATALKLASIRYAIAAGNRTIITFNEIDNPMLDINLRMGFVKQPPYLEYRKTL